MYREEWILSDGSLFNSVIRQGEIESDIEYQMRPYYSAFAEGWIYPIPDVALLSVGPDGSITHKLTIIK